MTWEDTTTSDTTTFRNTSRFVRMRDFQDSGGGVDFQLTFETPAQWYFTSTEPMYLSDSTRNDPIY